jgi:hypothetical protein
MPLSSTNARPFAVSPVQSACADADDEARTKIRAAIAKHILDIAAALLMVIFETRAGRQRQCLRATIITTSTFVTCEASDPSATTVPLAEHRDVTATNLRCTTPSKRQVCAVTSYDGFSSLSWTCQRAQRALRGFGRQLAAITGGDFALHVGNGSRPLP